jgi:hypothetical protein
VLGQEIRQLRTCKCRKPHRPLLRLALGGIGGVGTNVRPLAREERSEQQDHPPALPEEPAASPAHCRFGKVTQQRIVKAGRRICCALVHGRTPLPSLREQCANLGRIVARKYPFE